MGRLILLLLLAGVTSHCARGPIKSTDQAMRLAKEPPKNVFDDMGGHGLKNALVNNVAALRSRHPSGGTLKFGPRIIDVDAYIRSLEALIGVIQAGENPVYSGGISPFLSWKNYLLENFEFYEIYGRKKWGDVFMTSYYEPVIEGSRKPTKRFSQPLYGVPKDMVKVDIKAFAQVKPKLKSIYKGVLEQKSRSPILRGRLIPQKGGSASYVVKPYFDRKDIDQGRKLRGRQLEIAWVDPIESFFLQIQGSGVVRFKNGKETRVGYASQNGHPYVAIGSHLLHVIPREKMSLQAIENHLRSLPKAQMQKILNLNPSYVFFNKLRGGALGYLGAEVVPGRTIATDYQYFPKGALAYLEFEKPQFDNITDQDPKGWQKTSRFVLDQDTGGAIRGPGRLDLFWGAGAESRQAAGVMKNYGRLYYLAPKPQFLQQLSHIDMTRP